MNKHQQILERFCSTDSHRIWMNTPHKIGEKVYATDATVMVRMPANYDPERTETDEKTANKIQAITWPEHKLDVKITLDQLKQSMAKIKKESVPATKTCQCCKGDGIVEYDFEYENTVYSKDCDCPICDGDGELPDHSKPKTFRYEEDFMLKIVKSLFYPSIVDILIFTMEKAGATECTLVSQEHADKGSFFTIGEIEAVFMPVQNI